MKLRTLVEKLGFEVLNGAADCDVTGGYTCDLPSDALAHAKSGMIWITSQPHRNTVAVSVQKGVAVVLLTGGVRPDEQTLLSARREEITLLATPMPTFEVSGRLYEILK